MKTFVKNLVWLFIKKIKILSPMYYTRGTQSPCKARFFLWQKVLRFNSSVYWPVHFASKVSSPENIFVGIDAGPGFMPGCYIYGNAGIYVGHYTQIAPNVGIMSGNHDVHDSRKTVDNDSPVVIGDYCWIGMNSMILPKVVLGDHTIVAAGAVVTKSFPKGHCVLAGVPAKVVKELDPQEVVKFENKNKFHGYISHEDFESFSAQKLAIEPYSKIRSKYGLDSIGES
ncbi:conserved hypothetical protein [Vibrio rotiferianus]|uniref:acyltransferase n=1 Tax=Vibrio rotiferianus TaxID=190895 RepID=UPI002894A5CD|nr:conserved hypothetical protein [Vibrio rotiferianus]